MYSTVQLAPNFAVLVLTAELGANCTRRKLKVNAGKSKVIVFKREV